jgi:hypothetical protein
VLPTAGTQSPERLKAATLPWKYLHQTQGGSLNDYLPPTSTGSLREPTQTTRGSTLTTRRTSDARAVDPARTPRLRTPSARRLLESSSPTARTWSAAREGSRYRPPRYWLYLRDAERSSGRASSTTQRAGQDLVSDLTQAKGCASLYSLSLSRPRAEVEVTVRQRRKTPASGTRPPTTLATAGQFGGR